MIAPRKSDTGCFQIPNSVRDFVYHTLCETNQLAAGAFPMQERVLLRKGEPCGVLFCLYGPRLMRVMAIWDRSCQTVVFYNAAGERYLVARSPESVSQ